MFRRNQLLTPIAKTYFQCLRWIDARRGRPSIKSITTERLQQLQQSLASKPDDANGASSPSWVIVDVRSDDEVNVSMIPGAITKATFENNRGHYDEATIIPYCTIGGRSFLYARKLAHQEACTLDYHDGIVGWCNAHLPLVTPDGRATNRVHIDDPKFEVPDDYEVVH